MVAYIERYTGQTFGDQAEYSTRVFDGTGKREIVIDKFYDLGLVEINEEMLEVFAYPANRTPQWRLVSDQRFTYGLQNVEVTAKWGYGVTPEDIRFACLVLLAGIVQKNVLNVSDKQSEKVGDYTVSYSTERQMQDFNIAKQTLENYKEIAI